MARGSVGSALFACALLLPAALLASGPNPVEAIADKGARGAGAEADLERSRDLRSKGSQRGGRRDKGRPATGASKLRGSRVNDDADMVPRSGAKSVLTSVWGNPSFGVSAKLLLGMKTRQKVEHILERWANGDAPPEEVAFVELLLKKAGKKDQWGQLSVGQTVKKYKGFVKVTPAGQKVWSDVSFGQSSKKANGFFQRAGSRGARAKRENDARLAQAAQREEKVKDDVRVGQAQLQAKQQQQGQQQEQRQKQRKQQQQQQKKQKQHEQVVESPTPKVIVDKTGSKVFDERLTVRNPKAAALWEKLRAHVAALVWGRGSTAAVLAAP